MNRQVEVAYAFYQVRRRLWASRMRFFLDAFSIKRSCSLAVPPRIIYFSAQAGVRVPSGLSVLDEGL